MRIVVQRVKQAKCIANQKITGRIDTGLLAFVGIGEEDTPEDITIGAEKLANLRIFEDTNKKMSLSAADVGGEVLLIPNFTLYGSVRHGRRPDFTASAKADKAREYFEALVEQVSKVIPTRIGAFGEHMDIVAENDGPVTIIIDTKLL